MRISMPATSDYWVNDSAGDPLFVVTAEANAGLVKMLPAILAQVRALVGKRRLTVVFDRGGYSSVHAFAIKKSKAVRVSGCTRMQSLQSILFLSSGAWPFPAASKGRNRLTDTDDGLSMRIGLTSFDGDFRLSAYERKIQCLKPESPNK
jgi:hypothetical protein